MPEAGSLGRAGQTGPFARDPAEGDDAGQGVEALESEGRPRAIAEEAFEAGAVVTLDAHRSVDAEATRTPPAEHAVGISLIEQPVRAEVSEDAPLNDALKPDPVLEVEERRFVEDGPGVVPIGMVPILGSREDAVEDDEVEVGRGRPEPRIPRD